MTPCSACARHVKHDETACPFCGAPFVAPAPRNVRVAGRVTRAAIFSAALVACTKHEPPAPAPKTGSAEHLDQDFNQLLGSADTQATGSATGAALVDAAVAVVPDAGLSDEERTRRLQQAQEKQHQQHADEERRRRELEQQRIRQQQQEVDMQHNAKPYGAPPARRRVV